MLEEITMPKLSDTMEEGTVLKWLKKVGDYVQKGEPLFEVETDKAVMEVESFVSGVLSQILVREGEKAPVGTTVAIIGGEVGKPASPKEASKKEAAREGEEKRVMEPDTPPAHPLKEVSPEEESTAAAPPPERVNVSPLAKSYAEHRGIDLSQVRGTGREGMVTLSDVRSYRDTRSAPLSAPSPLPREVLPGETITDLSKMRKAIAATVSYSKQHIPHFYVTYEIDMDKVTHQLHELNQKREGKEKITLNDVIIRAAAAILKNYPSLNALYPPQGLILKKEVNIGVVIGMPEGLVIPVLKNCDRLTLEEISRGVRVLRERAESGKFSSTDFADGTFSISNLGMLGVSEFAAIIYPPQTAILAVGTIKETPSVSGGTITTVTRMNVTLSIDHRVVDGITAAHFLRDLKRFLENEEIELMEKPCCTVEDE